MDLDELGQRATAAGSDLDPEDQRRLLGYLVDLGAQEGELLAAIDALNVGGLALDLALRTGARHPFEEIALRAGLAPADAARYWRSLGFPDPIRNATTLPEEVIGGLELLVAARALIGEDATLALGRVIGTASSRIAQAVLDAFRVQFEGPQLRAGASYSQVVREYTDVAREMVPRLVDVIGSVLARHMVAMAASAWSADAEGGAAQQDLAVGFADLTGYTALSRSLVPRDLTRIIGAFEEAVSEAASHHHGRIVKLVGDGAMFSADDARQTCRIAAAIVEAAIGSDLLPSVRVGVAAGPVVNLGGDLFGPVVNLAARLAAVAPENGVVVDAAVHERSHADLAFEALPPQDLKGIGAPALAFRLL